ncbi:MAG TPA: DUF6089 family protein [Chitinophagaceae bacterium]|nr:DUF6089 family protein [Chitinophagaceae bacterium]
MKFYLLSFFILISGMCQAQEWDLELMPGVAAYNGDLTERRIALNYFRPAAALNLKYNSGDYFNFRIGFSYARIGADDKDNPSPLLKERNLSFRSNIFELNVMGELTLFDPESFDSYPYVMGGVGIFHFNPYAFDDNGRKVFLQPLSTEGEGLKEFPGRKKYSLYQICIPVGFGWKWTIKEKWNISYEFGYRITFTDYLDDVSKNYVDFGILQQEKGNEAVALSYRGTRPFNAATDIRGNSAIKDSYFFNGIKIGTSLDNLFWRTRD